MSQESFPLFLLFSDKNIKYSRTSIYRASWGNLIDNVKRGLRCFEYLLVYLILIGSDGVMYEVSSVIQSPYPAYNYTHAFVNYSTTIAR